MKKKKSIVVFLLLLLLLLILTSCSKSESALNISQSQGDFLKTKPETITSKYDIKYSGDFFIRLHFYLKKGKVDWEVENSKGDIVLRGYVINENGTTYRQLTYPLNFSEDLKQKKAVKPTSDTTVEIFNTEDFGYLPFESGSDLGIYTLNLKPTNAEGKYNIMWSNGVTEK